MALIWKVPVTEIPHPPVGPSGFSWDQWYQKNKGKLAEKRAKRYREDAAYRTAALERARTRRALAKVPVNKQGHTVSFLDAAEALNVTIWVLREWRHKNYFPEPFKMEGRLWFTPSQVQALQALRAFFAQHGGRVTTINRPVLDNVTSLVYANW